MLGFSPPTTTTVRVSATVSCSKGRDCDSFEHTFTVEETAQLPLLCEQEAAIKAKLHERLDRVIAKFMEQHHA